jgi:L-glyceraldehyde 3-phosphate reductase
MFIVFFLRPYSIGPAWPGVNEPAVNEPGIDSPAQAADDRGSEEVPVSYQSFPGRYDTMKYNRCGASGLLLPAISLGLWNNFGGGRVTENMRDMVFRAFDLGITHFDLANNYGPPPGSAETNFGRILGRELAAHRDELIVSTKAGYLMWPGPYGNWGSRKYLLASLDQSLQRLGLEYVDIFYSHRFDPGTPLEETMGALAAAIAQGKALYAGLSSYSAAKSREAAGLLRQTGVRCLIHQPSYSMLNRWIERDLLDALPELGMGCIAFSPLAQGLLAGRYLQGVPKDSRAGKAPPYFKKEFLSEQNLERVRALAELAKGRGQSLAQMALAWCLRDPRVTSVLTGASSVRQVEENVGALKNPSFSAEELREIDRHATEAGINIWAQSSEAG